MSQTEPENGTEPALPVPKLSPLAGFLSYLVPGLGQIVQGRVVKGVFFMVVLLGMFHAGQAMGGWKNVYMPVVEEDPRDPVMRRSNNPLRSIYYRWHFAGQFFIGVAAWPAILQYYDMPLASEKNNAFVHEYQREPMTREKENRTRGRNPDLVKRFDEDALSGEGKLNREIAAGDKGWDLGWVYTVIAGVLNILVIYDAVAGPAFGVRRQRAKPASPQPEAAAS